MTPSFSFGNSNDVRIKRRTILYLAIVHRVMTKEAYLAALKPFGITTGEQLQTQLNYLCARYNPNDTDRQRNDKLREFPLAAWPLHDNDYTKERYFAPTALGLRLETKLRKPHVAARKLEGGSLEMALATSEFFTRHSVGSATRLATREEFQILWPELSKLPPQRYFVWPDQSLSWLMHAHETSARVFVEKANDLLDKRWNCVAPDGSTPFRTLIEDGQFFLTALTATEGKAEELHRAFSQSHVVGTRPSSTMLRVYHLPALEHYLAAKEGAHYASSPS